jgi:hypothetical protein
MLFESKLKHAERGSRERGMNANGDHGWVCRFPYPCYHGPLTPTAWSEWTLVHRGAPNVGSAESVD